MVTALRFFFRFLFQHGQTESDLAGAVPTVPQWRLAELPKYLTPEEVERVVRACQRDTPVARRDRAILLLLARLGLRAGEVIALELDDIDWRAGVLKVRGKGGSARLPAAALPMSAKPWPATSGTIARPARRGASSSDQGASSGIRRPQFPQHDRSPGDQPSRAATRTSRGRTSCGTPWRPGCSVPGRPWTRSARSSATARRTPRRSTRRSMSRGLRSLALPWPTKGAER